MICKYTISTAGLAPIARTDVVAVAVRVLKDWNRISTPTLLLILGPSINPAGSETCSNAFVIGVRRSVRVDVGGKLTARVVLSEASNVAVLSATIGKQWANLLCDCIAIELHKLFAKIRVTGIHCPVGRTSVAWTIDLRPGNRAVERGCSTLSSGQ
jgi:hypothetical protein